MSADKKAKPVITPTPDGPYVVKELENFSAAKGPLECKPTMALCRCGGSSNKPFCDGTHATNGFSSQKLEDRVKDKREDYVKGDLTIHDNRGICAHAGRCTDGLPSVWRLKTEPWIDPEGADDEKIIATIKQCPSGALSYSLQGREHRDHDGDPAIFIAPNGPYVITGGVDLADTVRGEGASTEHFDLCRCGGSKNKPFCDGAHWYRKFDEHAEEKQA